jgi:hypothetical protein
MQRAQIGHCIVVGDNHFIGPNNPPGLIKSRISP